MARARGATDDNEWSLINLAFMTTGLWKLTHDLPSRNAARMNVGMLTPRFRVAMRNDTANVNVEKVSDGCRLSIRGFRPPMLRRRLIYLAANGAQKKNVHIGTIVKNSIRRNQLYVGQLLNPSPPLCSE